MGISQEERDRGVGGVAMSAYPTREALQAAFEEKKNSIQSLKEARWNREEIEKNKQMLAPDSVGVAAIKVIYDAFSETEAWAELEEEYFPSPKIEVEPPSDLFPDLIPAFPAELKKLNRWIVRTADKLPFSAWEEDENLGPIDPHEDRYQSDFNNVMGALDQTTKFSGAGFVFNYKDGYTGVDFDDCVNVETREIRADVREIILKLNTYCEFSPSGTGIHAIVKGWQFPIGGEGQQGSKVGKAEIYSGKRYFTVTGNHVPGTPSTVNERDLQWLYERIVAKKEFVPAKKTDDGTPAASSDSSCVVTLKKPGALSSKYNTLMCGTILRSKDTTGSTDFAIEDDVQILEYESQSSADYALLRLIMDELKTEDPAEIEAKFLKSPLGQRSKAHRGDYLERSIAKLLKEPRKLIVKQALEVSGETMGLSVDRPKLLTEVGNARRLIEAYGKNIRYSTDDALWLYFGGKVWQTDRRGVHIDDLMKRVLMSMQEEAQAHMQIDPALLGKVTKTLQPKMVKEGKERKEVELTEEERKTLNRYANAKMYFDWAKSSESNQKIHGAVEQAKSEPGISIAKTALDANKLVCNMLNGAFEFDPKTGEIKFRKHLREDYCTKMMPVIYDPNAACPQFHEFFRWMFPDPEVRKYLQTYLGLCLTGLVVRKALILYGEGSNGKSTLVQVLHRMFDEVLDEHGNRIGLPYGVPVAFSTFAASDETAGGTRADLLPLKGARFVTASESNKKGKKNGVTLDMARIKEMTGGDPTVARGLFEKDPTKFHSQAKIVLQTNNLPRIDDDSDGAWERLKVVLCAAKVKEEEQDESLPEKLFAESSGILNWLLEGLQTYFREGFHEPAAILQATEEFRGAENHMGRWASEELEKAPGSSKIATSMLFDRYKTWCYRNGEDAESVRAVSLYLQRRMKAELKHTRDGNILSGVKLKDGLGVTLVESGNDAKFVNLEAH